MDDYEYSELVCPKCGHEPTHERHCRGLHCDDGWIDEYYDDPINFAPGSEYVRCQECHGHGIERWCPECGADYWIAKGEKENEVQRASAEGE